MATNTRRRRARSSAPAADGNTSRAKKKAVIPADILACMKEGETLHGTGIANIGSNLPRANVIPTGCFMIDFGLLGGLPQGYISMAYGFHSSGKSTFFLRSVAQYQRKHPNKWVVWIDTEGLYDPLWAEKNGVETDRLIHVQPEYGEQAVDFMESFLKRESVGLIVLDSIPATVPLKVLENATEDETMAALARLMGKMSSKITMGLNAERRKGHWVTVWNVNQFRNKVGFVMGSPLHLPGGIQINHIASTKVWLKVGKQHMTEDEYGNEVPDYNEQSFKFEKTKFGSSIKDGAFQLILNPNHPRLTEGSYDNVHQCVTYAKKMGFVTGAGANWYLHTAEGGKRKFTKKENLEIYLHENPVEYDTLARSVIAEQRRSKRLDPLPPDGYLVSPFGRLVLLADLAA